MGERFTVFGGYGFVGSEVTQQLLAEGCEVIRVGRTSWPRFGENLGNVIFTIGMTADFRTRLVETIELQILRLYEALTRYRYESFLGLSSARVYEGAECTQEESPLIICPLRKDHVYNISKLAGESLCFAFDNPRVRVVRLSNVYGAADDLNLFMTAVIREAIATGSVTIGQDPGSSKDYIAVEDAARLIIAIARNGRQRLYNVASGTNFTHRQIANVLEANGYTVTFKSGGAAAEFPAIEISRIRGEFSISPPSPETILPNLIKQMCQKRGKQ